ncbi:hypothetical protein G3A_13990 [Bacillus sp. 17376]|nr:hypothetical protein G3A_13990 [Bacillus sp. 17376]
MTKSLLPVNLFQQGAVAAHQLGGSWWKIRKNKEKNI